MSVCGRSSAASPVRKIVVALLELAPAEHERVEAGLVRVQLGVRVAPLEPERAGALAAGREDRRAVRRQDAAAVDLVLGDQLALGVRGVVRDAVGGEHLDVVDLQERDQEQREQGHPELADLPLHLSAPPTRPAPPTRYASTRSTRPRRADRSRGASGPLETRTSSPSRTKFEIRLEPP